MFKPVIITVTGGSSSGKTTVVNEILAQIKNEYVVVIKQDDYYNDQSQMTMEERLAVNYDHPLSFDNDLFYQHIKKLMNGEAIEKPTYDYVNYTRAKKTELVKPGKIIILEGILVLDDERIRDLSDIKIFVEADEDLRFIRRLKRDTAERGRTIESITEQYLKEVKPMHYAFVKPTKRYADIIIPNDISHDVAVDLINAKIMTILNK